MTTLNYPNILVSSDAAKESTKICNDVWCGLGWAHGSAVTGEVSSLWMGGPGGIM